MGSSSGKTLMERIQKSPICFVFAITVYLFYVSLINYRKFSYVALDPNYVVNSPGCKIMEMNPFDESVKEFLLKGIPFECAKRIAKLDKQRLKIDKGMMKTWKKKKNHCCYRAIHRVQQPPDNYNQDADYKIEYGSKCQQIPTDNGNHGIIVNDSFIRVECQGSSKTVEFEGIALPPKVNSETTRKKADYWDSRKKPDFLLPPSILVIGIDSFSRMHMTRSLPKTRKHLLENDFIEMKGYTKVGPNTFPNIMAGFGGMKLGNYTSCWPNSSVKLDDCPFIWKKYSELNYMTAFLEDSPRIGIFNYEKVGFVLPPADYYMRPLTVAAHNYNNWSDTTGESPCVGGVSPTHYQANFIKEFVENMGKDYPCFLFSWFTSIGHEDFNRLQTADNVFHDLISGTMNKTNANPDNTIIIFMSDHGYRYGSFRETFLGFYEDSLPAFFFRLPPSLKAKYPDWYSNLKRNSEQLTSTLDLHSTLTHILYEAKSKIENPFENSSTNEYTSTTNILSYSESTSPKFRARYSFFEYVPGNRSCESSSIQQRDCMCGVTPLPSQSSTFSSNWGDAVVFHINELLQSVINSGQCARLKFTKLIYSREVGYGEVLNDFKQFINYTDHLVALEAVPSKAHFESKIRILQNFTTQILGDISRINSYEGQSDCVSDFSLKPYCFCNKLY